MTDRSDEELAAQVRDLHDHLAATEQRPLPETANRWLGEAQAVAADAVGEDVPPDVVETRVGQVADLLEHVEATGDPAADEHVESARELAATVLARVEDGT